MNTRQIGAVYEEKAARWLTGQGAQIVAKNFRCRFGEIDLVARHQDYLVFVEVKYRRTIAAGYPIEAVTPAKQKNICKVADFYRVRYGVAADQPVRYDVVAIMGEEITWYQNAFNHMGRGW
jgi:putative endonuclease